MSLTKPKAIERWQEIAYHPNLNGGSVRLVNGGADLLKTAPAIGTRDAVQRLFDKDLVTYGMDTISYLGTNHPHTRKYPSLERVAGLEFLLRGIDADSGKLFRAGPLLKAINGDAELLNRVFADSLCRAREVLERWLVVVGNTLPRVSFNLSNAALQTDLPHVMEKNLGTEFMRYASVEITEHLDVERVVQAGDKLSQLQEMGVHVNLDEANDSHVVDTTGKGEDLLSHIEQAGVKVNGVKFAGTAVDDIVQNKPGALECVAGVMQTLKNRGHQISTVTQEGHENMIMDYRHLRTTRKMKKQVGETDQKWLLQGRIEA